MEQINKVVSNRIREDSNCCNLSMDQDNILAPIHWKDPRFGTLKINCDATIGTHFSSIALVARDLRGSIVLVMSKKVYTASPLQAEAEAILWASLVASNSNMEIVCVESDSKLCIDALQCKMEDIPWCIRSGCAAVLYVFQSHPSWDFNWVKRGANHTPHTFGQMVSQ